MVEIIPPKHFKMNLNKKPLTKTNLNTQVSDVQVYAFYTGREIKLQSSSSSPFRDDKHPSFGYYIGISGEICWKDFTLDIKGDYVEFVKQLFNLDFNQALVKIVEDFGLQDEFEYKPIDVPKTDGDKPEINRNQMIKKLDEFKQLDIKSRKAELYDIEFWLRFGITKETLIKYNVTPIEWYFINGNIIKTDKYAYAFVENKDNIETYKIYQPFNKEYKWINNHNDSVWQGWNQLPPEGDMLIITKSLKDVMSIVEVLGIPAISLQSESVMPKKHIVDELKERFDAIYLLYDNDYDKEKNWGQIYGTKLANEFGFWNIAIQDKRQCKDFSELVETFGAVSAKKIWDIELSIPY
jgi:hypothetical protein